jgi:hypothetical protein
MGVTPDGVSAEDWERVHLLALDVANLSTEQDEAASDEAAGRLRELLDDLQEKYGPLPSLLATRADYVDEPEGREYWLLAAYSEAEKRGDLKNRVLIASSLASYYIDEVDGSAGTKWLDALSSDLDAFPMEYEGSELERLRGVLERRRRS